MSRRGINALFDSLDEGYFNEALWTWPGFSVSGVSGVDHLGMYCAGHEL